MKTAILEELEPGEKILGSKNSNEKDGLPWGATTHF